MGKKGCFEVECCFVEKCFEDNDPCNVWVPSKCCKCKKRTKKCY